VGQKGTRYTVNDGSVNNWTLQLASRYGKTLTASSAWRQELRRRATHASWPSPMPLAATTTLTVTEQIDSFLASNTFGANDLVMINGGISDLIANMAAVRAGTMTTAADDHGLTPGGYQIWLRRCAAS
jgi:outer membrane lipase/esterase